MRRWTRERLVADPGRSPARELREHADGHPGGGQDAGVAGTPPGYDRAPSEIEDAEVVPI